jgi:hypothetical protein
MVRSGQDRSSSFARLGELQRGGGVEVSSYGAVLGFMKLLLVFLTEAETWNMLNMSQLQLFDIGLKGFRHYCVRWIVDTARLIASPQISSSSSWWTSACFRLAFFQHNEAGCVVSFYCMAPPRNMASVERNLANSLRLNNMDVDKDWSLSWRGHDSFQRSEGPLMEID